MEGFYWQLVGGSPAAAQHPTTPKTAPVQGRPSPKRPRRTHQPWVLPEQTRVPTGDLGRGSGGGYPHMKAWETEAQFKWLVQSHTKWSLLPVYVLSSLTTSSVLPDMEPPKASKEVQWGRGYRSGSAGSPGPRAGLALWAPRNVVSCATRGQQRLGNDSMRLRLLLLEGTGCSSRLLGSTCRDTAAEAGLSTRAPASGLWAFFCLCFTAPR